MSETMMQLDILTEIHEVRRKIHRMKPKERRELMRNAEEIANLLKKGDIEHAKEKITKLTKKE
jgi:hypothetical protein